MSAADAITRGSLRTVFDKGPEFVRNPVLQCVQIKPMENKTGDGDRFRLVLSDVDNFIQTMLSTQNSHYITENKLKRGSIIRLLQYNPQIVKLRKIFIILDLEVLPQYGEPEKIGDPKGLDPPSNAQNPEPQPAAISGNGFYGNGAQQQQQQFKQEQQNHSLASHPRANVSHSSHGIIQAIESLSPYATKWTIKARVTSKGDIKTWHNKNGEGKLFSVNLLDESGEIRATGFNDQCDALYPLFQEGSVYYISSPCSVKLAKKQFSNLNNDYELTFERDTVVEKAEDQADVPQVRYNFRSIGDLESVDKDTLVDTIGILKDIAEVSEVTSKTTNKPFAKRDLTIVDSSMQSIRLTVWGNTAKNFTTSLDSVIAFKGAKVSDFGGRSLSLTSSGTMNVDPDIDEAHKLKGWYDAQGSQVSFVPQANTGGGYSQKQDFKTITQVKDEHIGMSDEAEFFNLKATIVYIRQENFAYEACQSENCNKKVVEEGGGWRCMKCDKSFPKPQYRYIMSCSVCDHTGQMYLSCFDESARVIMGMEAEKLTSLRDDEDSEEPFKAAFAEANCKTYIFRVKAKQETYQEEQRVRYQIQSARPVDYAQEANRLANIIKQYSIDTDSLFVQ